MKHAVTDTTQLDVSVVIPCLNEHETIESCVRAALNGIERSGRRGEVVVADNGSTDGSAELAAGVGARVIPVTETRGYGAALLAGISEAQGRWVIMGDGDQSYDFGEVPRFLARLEEGWDLVQGCRLPSGGGTIEPGAMRVLHQYLGNPGFSMLARWWFGLSVHDVHCGLRGFRRSLPEEIGQRCTGMEFATEMLIKARLTGQSIAELPITLHRDGRLEGRPHLRTFRDGWRHLRFYLLYSPTWLFLVPGLVILGLGLMGAGLAWGGVRIGGVHLDVGSLTVSLSAVVLGYQAILFAFLTRIYGVTHGLFPSSRRFERWFEYLTLERGVLVGLLLVVGGGALLMLGVGHWIAEDLGPLDYQRILRIVVPGSAALTLGVQTVLFSFFFSILGMKVR